MKIYCDGSTKNVCYLYTTDVGTLFTYVEPHRLKTHNEAEYLAIVRALQHVTVANLDKVEICSDSQLVINQIKSIYETKEPRLQGWRKQVLDLEYLISTQIIYTWLPREENLAGIYMEENKL